ncbi:MAG: RNA polymerase sigma factor [Anaerolineaceae bacterium]|nr:RNA polymerase sigma factor [Anaerolineaceae bacterium]
MQELDTDYKSSLAASFTQERARIVNLCAYLTGRRDAADDLAQESLMEAWRSRHKLVDPSGYSRWLSVVARNVCLRWMRQQAHPSQLVVDLPEELPNSNSPSSTTADFEIELERDELADLLDRALAALPADTRTALVNRYVLEMPQSEIAGRMGISEGALEARLHRGKIILHRLLTTQLRQEAISYGLVDPQDSSWQETRLWCPICGQRKLYGTLPQTTGQFELHCPNCSWEPHTFFAQSKNMPIFNRVKGYKATLTRFADFMYAYIRSGQSSASVPCNCCRRPLPLHYQLPVDTHTYSGFGKRGMSVQCPTCGASSYACIYGFALDTPAAQVFWRLNPRMRTFPEQEIEVDGQPALHIRFQSLVSAVHLDLILSGQNYQVLQAHTSNGE